MKAGELFRVNYGAGYSDPADSLPIVRRYTSTDQWEYAYNNSFTKAYYVSVEQDSVLMFIDILDKHLETGVFLFEDRLVELDFASVEPV